MYLSGRFLRATTFSASPHSDIGEGHGRVTAMRLNPLSTRPDVRRGVGSTLVEALFPRAVNLRKHHVMIGGIDAAILIGLDELVLNALRIFERYTSLAAGCFQG